MSLFAIADTHLSLGTNKPMDDFPGWSNYIERLENNWNRVVENKDTVVIAGDISWAMNFDELKADFDFLNKLNGTKIILKGNHDYWWNTASKMNKFIEDNSFTSIKILHNNSYSISGISVCGSRGWMYESDSDHDTKVLNREVMRINASIEAAECEEKLVFLHYPPITQNTQCEEILELFSKKGIKKCFYGHLHGAPSRFAFEGIYNGVDYKLISCDRLSFTPYLIKNL